MAVTLGESVSVGQPVASRSRSLALLIALAVAGLVIVLALAGPHLAPHSVAETIGRPFAAPSAAMPLGADALGRDVLSRTLHGGRSIVLTSVAATLLSTILGMLVGGLAALSPGKITTTLIRGLDLLIVFPAVLLLLTLAAGFPGSRTILIVAITLTAVPASVRIIGAAARQVVGHGFVEVAIARGDNLFSIVRRDLAPNLAGPVLADAGLRFVGAIYLAATAGFLGLGEGPPAANWGRMIDENAAGITLSAWPVAAPALLLVALAVSLNVLADELAHRVGGQLGSQP